MFAALPICPPIPGASADRHVVRTTVKVKRPSMK